MSVEIGVNGAVVNVSASHARGPWFESRRLHPYFSLKASEFILEAPRGSPLEWGRRELKPIFLV